MTYKYIPCVLTNWSCTLKNQKYNNYELGITHQDLQSDVYELPLAEAESRFAWAVDSVASMWVESVVKSNSLSLK